MSTTYLYIDDEDEERIIDYIRALNEAEELEITNKQPSKFSNLIETINSTEKDGILLDWRLDKMGEEVFFKASSIAQKLRTQFAEEDDLAIPIVLVSTADRLSSYYSDETSHDLFDIVYDKLKDIADHSTKVRRELMALSKGYKKIKKFRNDKEYLSKILGIHENKFLLDSDMYSLFSPDEALRPSQEYAQFIINELIKKPGALINENYLAARLGVDKGNSDDWENLKEEELHKFKYTGPFNDGWDRWWALGLENWWQNIEGDHDPLQLLDAKERIDLLSEYFNLENLIPPSPIEDSYSTDFWTICKITSEPLSPSNGFKIKSGDKYAWQEKLYISEKAAREKRHITNNLKLTSSEQSRLSEYLKNYQEDE